MKIRQGFVTNSSSSSYIIAQKKMPQEVLDLIHDNPILAGYIKDFSPFGDVQFKDNRGLVDWLFDMYDIDPKILIRHLTDSLTDSEIDMYSWELSVYDKYFKYIDEGYTVSFMEVDYHNTELAEKIASMADGINTIIESDE